MKIKKILQTTLALVCVVIFMVACGSSTENNTSTQAPQPPRNLQPEDESMFTHVFDPELNGLRITQYHGELTQVMLPDEIMGFPIVAINGDTFRFNHVTDVFFPDTVQYFGWGGWRNIDRDHESPYHLVIPYGVTHLYQIDPRTGSARVSDRIGRNIRTLDIPSTVQYIGERAFWMFSSLTNLTIPYGVTTLGSNAFSGATSLLAIDFPSSLISVGGSSGLRDTSWWATQPDGVITIGHIAYSWKGDRPPEGSLIIPYGVTHINGGAFSRVQLTSVTLPDSVTHIGNSAFANNQLTSVIIPNSVIQIGILNSRALGAFMNNQLTSVTIPDSVTYISVNAFSNNPLDEATQARIREIQGR